MSFSLCSDESSDGLYLVPHGEDIGFCFLNNFILFSDIISEVLEFFQFDEIVSFVNRLEFSNSFFLLF